MSFPVPTCAACGHGVFPPRALCPTCGHRDWTTRAVGAGVVESCTEANAVRIAAVRVEPDVVLVVRLEAAAEPGDEVALRSDGGVPVAVRPTP